MPKKSQKAATNLDSSSVEQIRIPFNRSSLLGRELEHISKTMTIGQIAGDQTYSKRCHAFLEQVLGVQKVMVTTSCTHALEMCALLLDIQPGDEVIVPSFTFVSTANAFALRGARIIFSDIRPDTLNLDEKQLEGLISSRTKVVVPVHYAGVGCEMDVIGEVAARHGLSVVEDNAHGLFGKFGAAGWAPSVAWRPRVFMKPRISPAARAARCSSTTRA